MTTLTTPPAPRATAYSQPVPYLPGLDGLRALAVIAVVVYHGNSSWLRGGFLGVEIFFVISGYLITLLLLSEHRRQGDISLRHFWFRRARRLLPAVFALLIAVSVVTLLFLREEVDRLRGDLVAALTYTMNWHLILGKTSYFDQFQQPPLLRHLWSLAVEEQFYLFWPLLLAVLLAVMRKRPDRLLMAMGALAAASYVWMAVLYDPVDPSRAYYGTDTRIGGLMLGACLAVFWHPRQLAEGVPPVRPRMVSVAGALGLGALLVFCLFATERGAFLYRGGFLLVDLATLAVIAAIAHPAVRFGRELHWPVLVYLGTRSYSIYLWHWPVFALTRPGIDLSAGPVVVFVLRMTITMVLAELSYRLIETPIRHGVIGGWFRALRRSSGVDRARRTRRTLLAGVVGGAALFLLGVAVVSAKAPASDIEASIAAGQEALVTQPPATQAATSASAAPAAPAVGTLPPVETTTTVYQPPIATIAVGDSVMLGAAPKLLAIVGQDTYIDAKVSRQMKDARPILQQLADEGRLGEHVILHLGNNGPMTAETFRSVMDSLVNVPQVLVVNVRVTKGWEGAVNEVLASQVPTYPNAKLMDWWQASAMHGDWFYKDKTHLNPAGADAYARLVAENLGLAPAA